MIEDIALGPIKLTYNNEVIKIKDMILQGKVRAINNLSRKVKALKLRKGSEMQLEKNKRKADSFIAEIRLIKKLLRNEIANFAMENIENVDKFINTSSVTKERAIARLLSREPLQTKFKELKKQFSAVPTDKLIEPNPKKVKRKNKLKNAKKDKKSAEGNVNEEVNSGSEMEENNETEETDEEELKPSETLRKQKTKGTNLIKAVSTSDFQVSVTEKDDVDIPRSIKKDKTKVKKVQHEIEDPISSPDNSSIKKGKKTLKNEQKELEHPISSPDISSANESESSDDEEFDHNTESIDNSISQTTVDPFFVSKGGTDYISLAVPRPPDKIVGTSSLDKPNASNRKMRRAAQFNRDLPREKKKPKKFNLPKYESQDKRFETKKSTPNNSANDNKRKFNNDFDKSKAATSGVPEKLHPSWEAKKQKSTILPFQGNKIVFD